MVHSYKYIAFVFIYITQCLPVQSETHPVEDNSNETFVLFHDDNSSDVAPVTQLSSSEKPMDKEVEILFRVEETPRPFHLDCDAGSEDNSQVEFFWRKDDAPFDLNANPEVEMQQRQLIFHEPKDSDEGVYQCGANRFPGVFLEIIDYIYETTSETLNWALGSRIRVKKTYIYVPQVTLQHLTPVEGRPFQLECRVPDGYPKPTIEWKRQSIADCKVYDITNLTSSLTPENLTISNATRDVVSNDLKYVCFAKSKAVDHDVAVAEYLIDGLSSTEPEIFPSPNLSAVTGNNSDIYCRTNSPDDVIYHSDHKILVIQELRPKREELFTCTTNNDIPEYPIHITLYSAPRFVKKPEQNITAEVGQILVLPCEVEELPPSGDSFWTYNGEPADDVRFTINELALTIHNVKKSDTGSYGCRAVNHIGENYVETFLSVL